MNDDTANAGPDDYTAYAPQPADHRVGSDLGAPIADAAEDAVRVVGENVGLVVVGGLAVGLLAAALLPRSKKRKLKKRSRKIADMMSELGDALVAQVSDAASEGRDRLGSLSETVGSAVTDQAHDLSKQAAQAAQSATDQVNSSGKVIARALVKLIQKARP